MHHRGVHNVIKYPATAACFLEASARTTLGHLLPGKCTGELAIVPVPFTPASASQEPAHGVLTDPSSCLVPPPLRSRTQFYLLRASPTHYRSATTLPLSLPTTMTSGPAVLPASCMAFLIQLLPPSYRFYLSEGAQTSMSRCVDTPVDSPCSQKVTALALAYKGLCNP